MTGVPGAPTSTLDRILALTASQGIGAIIAAILVLQIQTRLDVLIVRVGDVVTACSQR